MAFSLDAGPRPKPGRLDSIGALLAHSSPSGVLNGVYGWTT